MGCSPAKCVSPTTTRRCETASRMPSPQQFLGRRKATPRNYWKAVHGTGRLSHIDWSSASGKSLMLPSQTDNFRVLRRIPSPSPSCRQREGQYRLFLRNSPSRLGVGRQAVSGAHPATYVAGEYPDLRRAGLAWGVRLVRSNSWHFMLGSFSSSVRQLYTLEWGSYRGKLLCSCSNEPAYRSRYL